MPYNKIEDLPESIRANLPEHAQHIFLETYNNAWDKYSKPEDRRGASSQEETAMKIVWSAVKKDYEKNEKSGRWERKE
jgi:cation transport regulator